MRSVFSALPLFCAASVGCSASLGSSDPDAEVSSSSAAVVLVERTVSVDDSARGEAIARFVRMRSGAVDDDAWRMVGAAIDFPALGTCAPISTVQPRESGPARAVRLIDVGVIGLEANGTRTVLQARRLPDIVDLVSGVVYSSRAPDPEAFPSDTAYTLHVGGRPELDLAPFVASATAPREVEELRIAGQDLRAPGSLVLPPNAETTLTWKAGSRADLVYVDVNQSTASGPSNVRCLFEDAGHGIIGSPALTGEDGSLTVHRLHRETFQLPDALPATDTGEIRFDFARTASFRR